MEENPEIHQTEKRIGKLQRDFSELEKICQKIDPYQKLKPADKKKLLKWKIIPTEDPFSLTNQLLRKLDEIETEIKAKQKLLEQRRLH